MSGFGEMGSASLLGRRGCFRVGDGGGAQQNLAAENPKELGHTHIALDTLDIELQKHSVSCSSQRSPDGSTTSPDGSTTSPAPGAVATCYHRVLRPHRVTKVKGPLYGAAEVNSFGAT